MPAPDSLEKWAAMQPTAAETGSSPHLAPQFSFVRAPKLRGSSSQGTLGVALGGGGGGGGGNGKSGRGGGAASKARAAFVGLGDPLPPGLARRWKDPSVPIDVDTEEVKEKERRRWWRSKEDKDKDERTKRAKNSPETKKKNSKTQKLKL